VSSERNSSDSVDREYPQRPVPAVHAVILRGNRVLLVKRLNEPSRCRWSLPGGRIELGETIFEAAKREVLEECSVEIEIERVLDVGNNIVRDDGGRIRYHYVLIYVLARHTRGEVRAQSDAGDFMWAKAEEISKLDMHPELRRMLPLMIEVCA
jgi:8-oxo-dGTP diphosphatase